jgi:hypothetical protein
MRDIVEGSVFIPLFDGIDQQTAVPAMLFEAPDGHHSA